MWGIHHAVLSCSDMRIVDDDLAETIREECKLSSETDIFSCDTVEVTRAYQGQDYPWYKSESYFACDPCGRISIAGDSAEGSDSLGLCSTPVPVKLLLHPLRGGSGSQFNSEAFAAAIDQCARESQRWSKKTALKALAARPKGLNPDKYTDAESRGKLMAQLRTRWEQRPICSSVAILVWQRYFELVAGPMPDSDNLAAQQILRWMPVLNDKTLPSGLVNILSTRGWVLRERGFAFEA
jgi:hypothetical protein